MVCYSRVSGVKVVANTSNELATMTLFGQFVRYTRTHSAPLQRREWHGAEVDSSPDMPARLRLRYSFTVYSIVMLPLHTSDTRTLSRNLSAAVTFPNGV